MSAFSAGRPAWRSLRRAAHLQGREGRQLVAVDRCSPF